MTDVICDDFKRHVSEAILGRTEPKRVEARLRRHIRSSLEKGETDLVRCLRLLLGELLAMTEEFRKADYQYRLLLKGDASCILAWLGLAESYIGQEKLTKAKRCLETAYRLATSKDDFAGQLSSLDKLAFLAGEEGHWEQQERLLAEMCRALEQVPDLVDFPLATVYSLIENGPAGAAAPYLDSLVKRCLEHPVRWGRLRIIVSLLVTVYRQGGLSDHQIRDAIMAYQRFTSEERSAQAFEEIVSRAIEARDHGSA